MDDSEESKRDQVLAGTDTYAILTCQQERRFWVSWQDNIIAVGTGYHGTHELLRYVDEREDAPEVQSVGVASTDTAGVWTIQYNQGE